MPTLIQKPTNAQGVYVREYDNRLFMLLGYGYYGSPSYYEIYEIDPDGNTISKIVTSDTTDNEDTYLQMYSPEHDGLIVSGRKSGGTGFIEVWKLDGTKVGSVTSPKGAYITGVTRLDDKYLITVCCDLNGFFIVDAVNLLDTSKWVWKEVGISWTQAWEEISLCPFLDKVLIIRFDKLYTGDLVIWDPSSDTFTQFDTWSGSGATRGLIFPGVSANDVMAVWTKAYSDNGFDVMMTKDLINKVKLSTEPFFDASIAGENTCGALPVSDNLIVVFNAKDGCTQNYIKIMDVSGKELWRQTFQYGHGSFGALARGRLFMAIEAYPGVAKGSLVIIKPDVIKDISATINPDGTITVTGTNITKAEAFKRFLNAPCYANKVADIPLGQATNIGTGYFRIRGR